RLFMFDIANKLAVQSWCFREFKTLPALIEQIKGIGLSRTELCAVHADFDKPEGFAAILKTFKDAGVQIGSIGVNYFHGNPSEERWFEFAKAAGATMISAHFVVGRTPAVFETSAKLAEKYGIRLGIHNHGGYDWLGSVAMIEHLMNTLPPQIGLC